MLRDYENGKHIMKNLKKSSKLLFSFILEPGVDQSILAMILMPFMFSPVPVKRRAGSNESLKLSRMDAYRYFSSHFEASSFIITFGIKII